MGQGSRGARTPLLLEARHLEIAGREREDSLCRGRVSAAVRQTLWRAQIMASTSAVDWAAYDAEALAAETDNALAEMDARIAFAEDARRDERDRKRAAKRKITVEELRDSDRRWREHWRKEMQKRL